MKLARSGGDLRAREEEIQSAEHTKRHEKKKNKKRLDKKICWYYNHFVMITILKINQVAIFIESIAAG